MVYPPKTLKVDYPTMEKIRLNLERSLTCYSYWHPNLKARLY